MPRLVVALEEDEECLTFNLHRKRGCLDASTSWLAGYGMCAVMQILVGVYVSPLRREVGYALGCYMTQVMPQSTRSDHCTWDLEVCN